MPETSNNEYVTKTDLKAALQESAAWTVDLLLTEMGNRFGEVNTRFEEVNHRLDRIDATLVLQGKELKKGAQIIAAFNEWMGKADADYTRVLSELTDLKLRVGKLEHPAA
jgi:hypothetical protein